MKPLKHAIISAHKFGGIPEDYLEIHTWFDHSKAHIADVRHRMLLHKSFGIWLCESVFGDIIQKEDGSFVRTSYITNSEGTKVPVRDIGEQHVLDDLGTIPSIDKCFRSMPVEVWMGGPVRGRKINKVKKVPITSEDVRKVFAQPDEPASSDNIFVDGSAIERETYVD